MLDKLELVENNTNTYKTIYGEVTVSINGEDFKAYVEYDADTMSFNWTKTDGTELSHEDYTMCEDFEFDVIDLLLNEEN